MKISTLHILGTIGWFFNSYMLCVEFGHPIIGLFCMLMGGFCFLMFLMTRIEGE